MHPDTDRALKRNTQDLALFLAASADDADPQLRYAASRVKELQGDLRVLRDQMQALCRTVLLGWVPPERSTGPASRSLYQPDD